MATYIRTPFAQSGDTTPIPVPIQIDNTVSWTQGYGPQYQANQETDPSALDVERDKQNYLFNVISGGVQQYQQNGFPDFITSSDNGGSPFPYDINAIVRYNPGSGVNLYISLTSSNTNLPTDTSTWALLSSLGNALYIPNVTFDLSVTNGDVVAWDNSSSSYKRAIATGTFLQYALGIADITNKRVLIAGIYKSYVGLTPNSPYFLSSSSAGQITTTPPSSNVIQIGIALSATTFQLQIQNIYVPNIINFTTNSTWTVPQNVYSIYVDGAPAGGGGGGSGGCPATTSNTVSAGSAGGGGGGAGNFAQNFQISVTPGTVLTINIGGMGVGGTAGTPLLNGGNGTNGGDSSIYDGITPLLILTGGIGGAGTIPGSIAVGTIIQTGGIGGDFGGNAGDIGMSPTNNNTPVLAYGVGGRGGSGANSPYGIGGKSPQSAVAGVPYGNQAPGIAGNSGNGNNSGGSGASGSAVYGNVSSVNGAIGGNGTNGFITIKF